MVPFKQRKEPQLPQDGIVFKVLSSLHLVIIAAFIIIGILLLLNKGPFVWDGAYDNLRKVVGWVLLIYGLMRAAFIIKKMRG